MRCCWVQILNHGGAAAGVQTLLFSATLPSWVRDITKRFLQPGFKTVDLVGSDKMKVNSIELVEFIASKDLLEAIVSRVCLTHTCHFLLKDAG